MDDERLVVKASWPGTTIDGEPGIVAGMLIVSRVPNGGVLLNLSVGPSGAVPEDFTFLEFPLSHGDAQALRDALS